MVQAGRAGKWHERAGDQRRRSAGADPSPADPRATLTRCSPALSDGGQRRDMVLIERSVGPSLLLDRAALRIECRGQTVTLHALSEGGRNVISSPRFRGEGDHAKHGGGVIARRGYPSTSLRLVPLPSKCWGGYSHPPLPPQPQPRFRGTPARPLPVRRAAPTHRPDLALHRRTLHPRLSRRRRLRSCRSV